MKASLVETIGQCTIDSSVGFAVLDANGLILFANPSFRACIGLNDAETATGIALIAQLKTITNASEKALSDALHAPNATRLELQHTGSKLCLNLHIDSLTAEKRLVMAEQQPIDITKNTTLEPLYQDPLTELGNRLLLELFLSTWKQKEVHRATLAMIMIDLDYFKQVNDTLGHAAGDTLLKLVAKRIRSVTRQEDTLVRMGGDEFLIIQETGKQPMTAELLGKRIIDILSRPYLIDAQQVNIGASVGIATLNPGTTELSDLITHADLALYEAKALGRGKVKCFEPKLAQRAIERRNLEIDLRRALVLKEFEMVYQPQVSMADGALMGFEALIRWQHPTRGMVSPIDFIPLAEATGEIHAIGEWTLRTACKEAMRRDGNYSVAVNVSPIQFENARIVDIVRAALKTSGLPAERLEIEITEGVLIKDYATAQQYLWEIKKMGVGIAMDDFGTGYSSLSYLNSFPFSKIKIDQSFVRKENTPKVRALVQAIITLGASLNIVTIAEGVETKEQFDELAAEGCMEAQGYLISRPIPPQAIADFIFPFKHPSSKEATCHDAVTL